MAVDDIENNELSALAPMRQSIFQNDNVRRRYNRQGFDPLQETEFDSFLGIAEGNRKRGKAIKAKDPVKDFPFNEKMTCSQLADIGEKVDAELNATTLESGSGSAFVKKSYAEYLGKLKRHKNNIDALMRAKKCDDVTASAETQRVISENVKAIQAAQGAAALPVQSGMLGGKTNTTILVAMGLGVAGLLIYMIMRK